MLSEPNEHDFYAITIFFYLFLYFQKAHHGGPERYFLSLCAPCGRNSEMTPRNLKKK